MDYTKIKAYQKDHISGDDLVKFDEKNRKTFHRVTMMVKAVKPQEFRQADEFGGEKETKLAMYFDKTPKYLIMNASNALSMHQITGSKDTDDWVGTTITLTAHEKRVFGKIKHPIDIEPADKSKPQAKSNAKKPEQQPSKPAQKTAEKPVEKEVAGEQILPETKPTVNVADTDFITAEEAAEMDLNNENEDNTIFSDDDDERDMFEDQ